MQDVEIRTLRREDLPQCSQLFARVFRRKAPLSYFDWKYFQHPWRSAIHAPSVIAIKKNRIIGMYCGLPHYFSFRDETLHAVQLVDNCVDKQYRGHTLHLQLYRYYHSLVAGKVAFGFGFPNGPALTVDTRYLGCPHVTTSELFVRSLKDSIPRHACSVTPLNEFSPDIDQLCTNTLDRECMCVALDHRYLQWRYAKNVAHTFHSFSIMDGSRAVGFAIVRLHRLWLSATRAYLYEFRLHPDVSLCNGLGPLLTTLRGLNVRELWVYASRGHLAPTELEQYGFTHRNGAGRAYVYQPLSEPWITAHDLHQPERWRIMLGDSDF